MSALNKLYLENKDQIDNIDYGVQEYADLNVITAERSHFLDFASEVVQESQQQGFKIGFKAAVQLLAECL